MSTEEQRESFRARLTAEEDWLYMEADEGEGAQQFKDRLQQLRDIGEPIKRRAEVGSGVCVWGWGKCTGKCMGVVGLGEERGRKREEGKAALACKP